jgi:hypothetical protein
VSELKDEYKEKVEFTIISAASPEGKAAAKKYALGGAEHGLIGLDPDGGLEILIPGHNYEKALIAEKIEEMLSPG